MRYTNKQLESMTDIELAADIIREKLAKLCNPYSPFASKLRSAYNTLREQAADERAMAEHEAQKELVTKIATAATDEIWGSFECGPTGNYWIDETHNLYCKKGESDISIWLESYFSDGELIDGDVDNTTTESRSSTPLSQEALREALRDIISRNTNILDLSQTA